MPSEILETLQVTLNSDNTQPTQYAFNIGPLPSTGFMPSGLFIGHDQGKNLCSIQGWNGGGKLPSLPPKKPRVIPASALPLSLQGKGGNVGIGTVNPNARLHVAGDVRINDQPLWLRQENDKLHGIRWCDTFAQTHINGPVVFGGDGGALGTTGDGNKIALSWTASGVQLNNKTLWLRSGSDINHGMGYYGIKARGEQTFADKDIDGPVLFGYSGGALGSTGNGERIAIAWNGSGNVGVGTSTPGVRLEVNGKDDGHSDVLLTGRFRSNSTHGGGMYVDSEDCFVGSDLSGGVGVTTEGNWRLLIAKNGNVGVGTLTPSALLEVNGDAKVNGTLNVTTDVILAGADCAEHFSIADSVEAESGTVMSIDDESTLRPCASAYDKRVAGVVSGAGDYRPGIILDRQPGLAGRSPIALVGKVFCKVDADFGAIEPGDLLTSSPTTGHAMKASDPARAFGAVIGKALRPLSSGRGLIPILVALQ